MENVIVSLFSVVILVVSAMIMVLASFNSVSKISDSFKAMVQQANVIHATYIDVAFSGYNQGFIVLTVVNSGQSDLNQFPRWNLLVQREDGSSYELPYSPASQPGSNQWALQGLFLPSGDPEVFDPNMLNPDEQMILIVSLDPPLGPQQVARLTVATPNGVTAQCLVSGPQP